MWEGDAWWGMQVSVGIEETKNALIKEQITRTFQRFPFYSIPHSRFKIHDMLGCALLADLSTHMQLLNSSLYVSLSRW
jgi:hypothetical protein